MKNFLKNLLLLSVSLVISLLLGEAFVRFFVPQQLIYLNPEIWRPDDTIGWRHQENVNTEVNFGEGMVHFVTDENGYRVNYGQDRNNKGRDDISILMIGDSYLEALSVENKDAIPDVVRQLLTEKYNKTFHVTNSGVGGWSPNHYLIEAKDALKKKNYDLGIVFLYIGNDIIKTKKDSFPPRQEGKRHHFRLPNNFTQKELIDAILYPVNDFLETRSHLYILLKTNFQTTLARLGLTAAYFPPVFKKELRESQRWDTTAEVCKTIDEEFKKHNTPVFFVLIPTNYQVHDDIFYKYIKSFNIDRESVDLSQPNTLLKEKFELLSLELVDPLEYMRKKAKEKEKMYGLVDKHFNAKGHHVLARYLIPYIETFIKIKLDE
jgi:lysophospholipase L1-like esterase